MQFWCEKWELRGVVRSRDNCNGGTGRMKGCWVGDQTGEDVPGAEELDGF